MKADSRAEAEERGGRWDVAAHPFFGRCAAGELAPGELAIYASEYEHGVAAIAKVSARAGEDPTRSVSCWRSFARAAGWGGWSAWAYGEEPLPETEACARVWAGDGTRTLAEDLVTLRTFERVESEVGELMLNGLRRHYGLDGAATEYFRLHAGAEAARFGAARESFEAPSEGDRASLLEQVEAVHRSYWLLLDGVESLARRACRSC